MKIRVVAAVVDTQQLTLYKEDGNTFVIPQGDARVARIITEISPYLNRQEVAEVDVAKDEDNAYQQFEKETKKSGGLVRLFRVAKSKVAAFFEAKIVPPMEMGHLPEPKEENGPEANLNIAVGSLTTTLPARQAALGVVSQTLAAVAIKAQAEAAAEEDEAEAQATLDQAARTAAAPQTKADTYQPVSQPVTAPPPEKAKVVTGNDKLDSALADIMKHAVPVSDPTFNAEKLGDDHDDTIVAVVKNHNGEDTIVPGVEKIRPQLARASAKNSTANVEAFLNRIGQVIDKRSHSIDDLLKFMERGDLPIAEDGSIIIYKVLKTKGDKTGLFFDVHTGKVPQKVGSYVFMDESLVDHNRNNECSNGLHVARRGYISGFSGDVCVLAKVAPEDVIAVPSYDANKMRVCGYHILFKLSESDHDKLRNNRPITDTVEGQQLLAKAMAGDHVARLETVRIGAHQGGNITVTPLLSNGLANASLKVNDKGTDKVEQALPDNGEDVAPAVDPKLVSEQIAADKAKEAAAKVPETAQEPLATQPATQSKADKAQALYALWKQGDTALEKEAGARQLRDFKKESKKSWGYLGLSDDTGELIARFLGEDKSVSKKAPTPVPTKPSKAPKVKAAVDNPKPAAPKTEKSVKGFPDSPSIQKVEPTAAEKVALAKKLLGEGKGNAEVALATGLSKDQVYRIKKKS